MTEPESLPPKYVQFNTRMLAVAIELGILLVIIIPLVNWMMHLIFAPINSEDMMPVINNWKEQHDMEQLLSHLWSYIKDHSIIERMFFENLMQIFLVALYILPFWFKYSTTPGKMLFRAQIRDINTGLPMTRKQSVIRFLGYIVSGLPFTLGFVWILFNKKHRGFHDYIAGTVVIIQPKIPKDVPLSINENEQNNV